MNIHSRILRGAAVVLLAAAPRIAPAQSYTATLDRAQEAPSIPAAGGRASLALNDDGTALTYDIRVVGIPNISAAHFHNAPAGMNGGVVRALSGEFDADGVWVSAGTWRSAESDQPLTAQLAQELRDGNLYVNVHSPDYPPGEIRGQIEGDGADYTATLGRAQEAPPIPAAGGRASLALNDDGTALTYDIRVVGIPNISAAHFHNAPAGMNGGVVRALSGEFDADGVWASAGTWRSAESDQPLTAQLAQELRDGNLYVNVHSPDYPPGEIRGQIKLAGSVTAVAGATWGVLKIRVSK